MLNIYYGLESINKEKFIFDSINKDADALEKKTIMIVPDQFSLQMEKRALEYFSQKRGTRALLNFMVTDFSALGHKVVKETGGKKPELIDKYGRQMLLSLIIDKLSEEGELSIYSKMGGRNSFTTKANQLISEMKRYGINAIDLEKVSPDTESFLKLKLNDIKKIFLAYEDAIEGHFIDSEDYILFYGELMTKSELIAGAEVWIYGFDTFTPINMEVIKHILVRAKDINLVLSGEKKRRQDDQDPIDARCLTIGDELFSLSKYVIGEFVELANSIGVEHRIQEIEASGFAEKKKSIWTQRPGEKIKLVHATNPYAEAEAIAAHIIELVREKNYKYSDITVISNDTEFRDGILKRTFDRWGIPSFSDTKRRVSHQPFVRFLLALLDIIVYGYRGNSIMNLISAGIINWSVEDEELMGRYVTEAKIRGNKWKSEFKWQNKKNHRTEYSDEELARLNEMRLEIVSLLDDAKERIGRRNTASEKVNGLYEFLSSEEFDIKDRIEQLIARQQELGLEEGASEAAQSWNMICELFAQIINTIGDQKISNEQLKEILAAGLKEMRIGIVPPSNDCVILGTLQRSRISGTKSLIVASANEGILPLTISENGLLTEYELEKLEELKLQVSKREQVYQKEEQLAIYRMFSLPEEELFVTCSVSDNAGKNLVPSAIFNILAGISKNEIMSDLGKKNIGESQDQSQTIELMPSRQGALSHLTEAIRGYIEEGYIDAEWMAAIKWFKRNAPDVMNRIEEGFKFDNIAEKLGRDLANDLYFGDKNLINVSVSRLESYMDCPFKHFISRGLRAEESSRFEIDPRTKGDIYHQTLQILSKELTPTDGSSVSDANSAWQTITKEECHDRVVKILSEIGVDYDEGVYISDKLSQYNLESITRNCSDIAWAMIEQVRKSKTSRMYFEEPFGFGSRLLKPIEIELADGKKAFLNGRIDRIDVMKIAPGENDCGDEKNEAIRVIDYKTGRAKVNLDHIEKGYNLQLMVYMEAVSEVASALAGAFYFKIEDLETDFNEEKEIASLEERVRKSCKLEGIFVDDENIWIAMDKSLEKQAGQENMDVESVIIPVKRNSEGKLKYTGREKKDSTGNGKKRSKESFDELRKKTMEHVNRICHEIQEGKIDIAPNKEKETCVYCKYKSICLFDMSFKNGQDEVI